jgi:hypothetical protein
LLVCRIIRNNIVSKAELPVEEGTGATKASGKNFELSIIMKNARLIRRVKTDVQCGWGLTDACPRNGKITSLSLKGCFVKTTAVAPDGQTIFVNCWLPVRRWLLLSGKVLYHIEKVGFGLSFPELNDEQRDALCGLIEYYNDNPVK